MPKKLALPLVVGLVACLILGATPASADTDRHALGHGVIRWVAQRQAADELAAIWRNAQDAGSYKLAANVEQVLLPVGLPDQIGDGEGVVQIHVEGQTQLPDRAVLSLRVVADGLDTRPMRLYRVGDEVFLQQGADLKPVQDPSATGLESAGYLDYLAGATNVQRQPDERGLSRYTFDIDGQRLAQSQLGAIERRLRSQGQLPQGAQLAPDGPMTRAAGHGELWANDQGLPVRQVIELDIPGLTEGYDAHTSLTVDFSAYGCDDAIPSPTQDADGVWRLEQPPVGPSAAGTSGATASSGGASDASGLRLFAQEITVSPVALASLLLLALAIAALKATGTPRQLLTLPNRLNALFAVAMVLVLIASPLLKAGQWLRLGELTAQAAGPREGLLDEPASYAAPEPPPDADALAIQASDAALAASDDDEDSDDDGLTNAFERALGTDPLRDDTDRDGLPDGVEVNGVHIGGRDWTSNPTAQDSNMDGLPDFDEWADPDGLADEHDPDGDGVPNIWDEDNDNDGLPDSIDLSPMAVGAYRDGFDVTTQAGDSYDGHLYVEFQVQPENSDHLRYSTATLDWPHDEEGQMTDLDDSTEDLRLTPFLRINSNCAPNNDLSREYGVRSWRDGDRYMIMAPLTPVNDGGRIGAFYTKVALSPNDSGHVPDLDWSAEMVWMVQAEVDQQTRNASKIVSTATPLHTYIEDFRLTGLKFTKSHGYDTFLLGTPGSQHEDRDLLQAYMGLNALFLEYDRLQYQAPSGESALDHLNYRFENTFPYTYTLGVNPVGCATTFFHYDHEDEALGESATSLIPDFVRAHFSGDEVSPTREEGDVSHAAILIATEDAYGCKDLSDWPGDYAAFNISMLNIPLVRTRGTKLATYRIDPDSGDWVREEPDQLLDTVEERYKDAYDDLVADLADDYPNLTTDALRYVTHLTYLSAWSGNKLIVASDDTLYVEAGPIDDAEICDRYGVSEEGDSFDDAPSFVAWVTGLGDELDNAIAAHERDTGGGDPMGEQAIAHHAVEWIDRYPDMANMMGARPVVTEETSRAVQMLKQYDVSIKQVRLTIAGGKILLLAKTVHSSYKLWQMARAATTARDVLKATEAANKFPAFALVGMIFSVAVTWVIFGLCYSAIRNDPAALNMAIAVSIVNTIWFIFLFALNFVPFIGPIISSILSVIDGIISWATDGNWSISHVIVRLFYDARNLTEPGDADFFGMETGVRDEALGLVEDNYFYVEADFTGTMLETEDAEDDDLDMSSIAGYFRSDYAGVTAVSAKNHVSTSISGSTLTECNRPRLTFGPLSAQRNLEVGIYSSVEYTYAWAEYGLYGAFRYATKTKDMTIPDNADDREVHDIVLDILPADLDGLWTWNLAGADTWNLDRDADGIPSTDETGYGTDPANWDTDGDGLSDKYELDNADAYGIDALVADTDGDGLDDGYELRLGTNPAVADTDEDGLTDAQEVYHQEGSGDWVGGWLANMPDGATARVYSDPLRADADQDNLNDADERANSLSPYAHNDAPRLRLTEDNRAISPDGQWGTWVLPGDPVEVDVELRNTGGSPVTTTLALCVPAIGQDVGGGDLTADDPPPTQWSVCDDAGTQLAWDFADHELEAQAVAETTVTFTAVEADATVSDTLDLTLTFRDREIERNLLVAVDADWPEIEIAVPAEDAFLRGDRYVFGGTADDEGSWVTGVEVSINAEGAPDGAWESAEGIRLWAYGWDLPADGRYQIRARGADQVDHETTTLARAFTVDNTPPTMSLTLPGGNYVRPEDKVVLITGQANDNLAGVRRVQLSMNGQPWRSVELAAPGATSTAWQYAWPVGDDAQGRHSLVMRAVDMAGNVSEAVADELIVDQMAPTDELADRTYTNAPPALAVGQEHILVGVANESGRLPETARPPELRDTMDIYDDSTVWLGLANIADNDQGVTAVWLGDVDNDRLADLAIGLPADDRVVIEYGQSGDWVLPPDIEMLDDSYTHYVGPSASGFGTLVAAAGDVDGDALLDIAIGQRDSNTAYIIRGRTGPQGHLSVDGPDLPSWSVIQAPAAIVSLAGAGDINDDGIDDLLVVSDGRAFLLFGKIFPWPETVNVQEDAAAILPDALSATGLGDVDGDGLADYAVTRNGSVSVYASGDDLETGDQHEPLANGTFATSDAEPHLAATGDLNGDDLADFVYSDGSTPRVVLGRTSGLWDVSLTLDGYNPSPSGYVAAPGDMDGDGHADLMLSNAADDELLLVLGRDDWSSPPPIRTTFEHATAIAQTPYAAAADVNGDGSSDLLLIPEPTDAEERGYDARSFAGIGWVSPDALPEGAHSQTSVAQPDGVVLTALGLKADTDDLFVDDDYCPTCDNDGYTWGQNAFDSVPAALATASSGATIHVRPGVYPAFTVASGDDNIALRGSHPDAVFIDGDGGPFGIKLEDVSRVTVADLTVRNANRGVWLDDAGILGHETPAYRCVLEGLLVHDCDQAIYSDRSSSVEVRECTLATDGQAAHPIIQVDQSEPDPDLYQWTTKPDATTDIGHGGALVGLGDYLYALPGGNSTQFFRYAVSGETWATRASLPKAAGRNADAAIDGDGDVWVLIPDAFGGFGEPVRDVLARGANDITVASDAGMHDYDGNAWTTSAVHAKPFADEIDGVVYRSGRDGAIQRCEGGQCETIGWLQYGGSYPGDLNAVAINGNDVYFGGDFTEIEYWDDDLGIIDRIYAKNIARWNANDGWLKLAYQGNSGLWGPSGGDCYGDEWVSSLLVKSGHLYVGGFFYGGSNADNWGDEEQVESHCLIAYDLGSEEWEKIVGTSGSSGGFVIEQYDYVDGTCDAKVYVHDLASWDSDTILIVGELPYYGSRLNDPGGPAWNMAFYNTNNTWSAPPTWARTSAPIHDVEWQGNDLYVGGEFTSVTDASTPMQRIARMDASDRGAPAWHALGAGVGGPVYAMDYLTDNDTLYVGGDFTSAGGVAHYNIAQWDEDANTWPGGQFLYEYDNAAWHARSAPPSLAGAGAALSADHDGNLYAFMGASTERFYRLDLGTQSWSPEDDLAVREGSVLCCADGHPYALTNDFEDDILWTYREGHWRIAGQGAPEIGIGADMVWDGADAIYLMVGGGSSDLWRFSLTEATWEQMDDPGVSAFAAYGHGLTRVGQAMYAYVSPMGSASGFYECARVGVPNTKLTLANTALVVPSTAGAPVWMSPGDPSPDYGIVDDGSNTWVADAAWSPEVDRRYELTHSRARLVGPSEGLYRPGRHSLLDAGYATYLDQVRVSPDYCAVCDNDGLTWGQDAFDSIQDGIDAGANHVIVGPGVYHEPFHLASGVSVAGHGADQTIVEAPVSLTGPLVQAEGVASASVSRMSLVGNGANVGLSAEDGAEIVARRMIVRQNATGIATEGATTDVEIANNTIVRNVDGIVLTADAPVDMRNTILANNSGRGLTYETDAARESHTYNDYWSNGVNLDYDDSANTPDPGAGEMFLDPLFEAALSHNYRPIDGSPAIDAGAPNDPAPAGTGGRTDMGYAEYGAAAYYVDDDYSPTGENDGLTWGSDAFAEIQAALDTAAVTIRSVRSIPPDEGYTVNVAPGNYPEAPSLPSYVHVVGSGADETTIELAQEHGAAVQMAGIVNASISDVEITGSKGASSLSLVDNVTTTLTCLSLDSDEHMVAGWLGEDITLAENDGNEWYFSVPEIITVTDITDIEFELDSSDNPHFFYALDNESQCYKKVIWLRWDGSEWIRSEARSGYAGDYIGFALDQDGNPLLGYIDDASNKLYMMRWDGDSWKDDRWAHYSSDYGYATGNFAVGEYSSEAYGKYRYAGYEYGGNPRRYRWWEGDVHSVDEAVMDSVLLAHDLSMSVEPSPHPSTGHVYLIDHYLYGDATNNRLRHWWNYSGNRKETIDTGANIGYYNDIAMDSHHMPHVVYTKDGELWYGCKVKDDSQDYTVGEWTLALVDDGSRGEFGAVAIDVDSEDQAHILYLISTPSGPRTEYRTAWFAGEQSGVRVSDGSHDVSLSRTLIHNVDQGVVFEGRSSGEMQHNTIGAIEREGVLAADAYTLLRTDSNIVTNAAVGLSVADSAQLLCEYDLLDCDTNIDGATVGEGMVYADPAFGTDYHITAASPALDTANPFGDAPAGGGVRADIGYHELIAAPLPLLFGQEIRSTAIGNSGVDATETGITFVSDPSLPVTETLPSAWTPATLTDHGEAVSQWQLPVTPDQEGLFRVYSRARDVVGNDQADEDNDVWYTGAYIGDATAPTVDWVSPTGNISTDGAAIRLVAQASDYIDHGDGPRLNVASIAFEVAGELQPAMWVGDPDWDASAQQPRQFEAHVSLPAGQTSVQAVVVDEAGHETRTSPLAVDAANADHCATITSHADGQVVRETEIGLRGYVRFSSLGSGSVDVGVSGQSVVQAELDNPIAQRTAWQARVSLPDSDGLHTISVTPTLGTAGTVSSLNLWLDRVGPTLDVASPVDGSTVIDTVLFEGTTSDALSSVAEIAYSLDGGYTWTELERQGDAFSVEVDLPDGEDSVSYPIRVRSVDLAGNETIVARVVSLDSQPPVGLAPTTFNHAPGTHVPLDTQLTMAWNEPFDAGGVAGTTVEIDMTDETVPTAAASGTSHQGTLDQIGKWHAHLAAEDMVGNERVLHYGPWHVDHSPYDGGTGPSRVTLKAADLASSRQSIIIDGWLDVNHDEWLPGEWLDDARWYGIIQDMYLAWDGLALYAGYSGAWWGMDGELWLYLDLAPGGSTSQPIGGQTLPVAADWAVHVTDTETALLWQWDGAGWVSQAWDDWAFGDDTGHTEIRLPWSTINGGEPATSLDLLVETRGPDGATGVVMPTTNPAAGPWTDTFHWGDIASAGAPGDGQPQAMDVSLDVACDTPTEALLGPDQTVRYRLTVTNHEIRAVSGVRIAMDATPGLGYYAPLDPVDGATCSSCPVGGSSWTLDLPELAASSQRVLTVTARTAADLTGIEVVTSTASMSASPDPIMGEPVRVGVSHAVDGQGAMAELDAQENAPVPVGEWQASGSAEDGDGIGVQTVQVRLNGGSWQDASGTLVWQSPLDIPDSDSVTVDARAQDAYGQYGAIATRNLLVDRVAPQLDWTAPDVCTGDTARLTGTAHDPAPTTGRVEAVELQFDDPDSTWLTVSGISTAPDGVSSWRYDWSLPYEDGLTHTIRARVTDKVGLVTTDTWRVTTVDAVAPLITTTKALADAHVEDYGSPQVIELMAGEITDGVGVDHMTVEILATDGTTRTETVTLVGESWRYAPDVSGWQAGTYQITVRGTDVNGNLRQATPHDVRITRTLPALEVDHMRLSVNGAPNATSASPDDIVQYRTIVRNVGAAPAAGVQVTATLPTPEMRYHGTVSVEQAGLKGSQPIVDGGSITWPLNARIASGEALTVTFEARVTQHLAPPIALTTSSGASGETEDGDPIVADSGDPNDADTDDADTSTLTAVSHNVTLIMEPERDEICAGWNYPYDLELTNDGDVTLSGVEVSVTLPESSERVLAESWPTWRSAGGNTWVWDVHDLAPSQVASGRLTMHAYTSLRQGETITVSAEAIGSQIVTRTQTTTSSVRIDGPCAPGNPTPTVAPTLTPSPTPPTQELWLPLILRGGGMSEASLSGAGMQVKPERIVR